MDRRKLILLFLAVVIGFGTILVMKRILANQSQTTTIVQAPTSQILAAARDLPAGTLLKDGDVQWTDWPADPANASPGLIFKDKAKPEDYLGSVLRQSARKGEIIQSGQIINPHDRGFLAAVLTEGMRAVSVTVKPEGEVAGFVFPGDHVDVILTHAITRHDDPDMNDRHVSETVLSDVRVLALDQKMDSTPAEIKAAQLVTLEVTPRQAEQLALAAQLGTLSLSLRSINAAETVNGKIVDKAGQRGTWDSDITHVFPSPDGKDQLLQKVLIIRGKDVSQASFERHQ
ncbi:MAG: Flp pilus assembly protein CpaB [Alphaproteobacteria bacterium]|nr:Flp pilus assembly protein CpaB [Alphaproteobacteria bacterium]MBV8549623.1 Flp pilus assembly protein CpaB [Alphaproteobacteria bacterium]